MAGERGEFDHRGRYVEIVRPERVRFTWISAATNDAETDVTITFESIGGDTRVRLVHTGLADATAGKRHEGGWQSILQKCAEVVAGPSAAA